MYVQNDNGPLTRSYHVLGIVIEANGGFVVTVESRGNQDGGPVRERAADSPEVHHRKRHRGHQGAESGVRAAIAVDHKGR